MGNAQRRKQCPLKNLEGLEVKMRYRKESHVFRSSDLKLQKLQGLV